MDKSDHESDEDYFLFYAGEGSESDCGGDASCDIVATAFAISRGVPDEMLVAVSMAGLTDPEMSNDDASGIYLYIDSDGDPGDWESGATVRAGCWVTSHGSTAQLHEWNGKEWQWTSDQMTLTISDDYWATDVPWREIGLQTAACAVRAVNATGHSDRAPACWETTYLALAEG